MYWLGARRVSHNLAAKADNGKSNEPEGERCMDLDELREIIQAAGGGEDALAYAEALLVKVNRMEAQAQYAPLVNQLRSAREEGDFRGRVLEVNFADCFVRAGVSLEYGAKQGMAGDIDFVWQVDKYKLFIEMKLLGQDRMTRDEINQQLEGSGMSATFVNDDTRDVARLQSDLMQKSSTRKFNPTPPMNTVNFVAVEMSELQLGTVDICDCLLAAGGKTMAKQYCDPGSLREPVVGMFEELSQDQLTDGKRDWLARVQKLAESAPHPRAYIHGVMFLFREPEERAALSYTLRAALVWNPALVDSEMAAKIANAFYAVIPRTT
jgi:hypothetical protein